MRVHIGFYIFYKKGQNLEQKGKQNNFVELYVLSEVVLKKNSYQMKTKVEN